MALGPPLPQPPTLPPSAPTLARHLAWALDRLRGQMQEGLDPPDGEDIARFEAGCAALAALPVAAPATTQLDGRTYWRDEDGRLVPEGLVKAQRLLEDELVRGIAAGALGVSGILARFRGYSMAEAAAYLAQLAQDYGADAKGGNGNISFFSYDRAWKVTVTRADRISFGPEIQVARTLIADFLAAEDGSDTLKALITRAFGLDREGTIRVAEVLRLRTYEITHPQWQAAMRAIGDSIRTAGTAEYLRVYRRGEDGRYEQIPLDLASV